MCDKRALTVAWSHLLTLQFNELFKGFEAPFSFLLVHQDDFLETQARFCSVVLKE